MPSPVAHAVTLVPHPESRGAAVRSVEARICREAGGTLAITFSIEGDLEKLCIPAPRVPRIVHGLWQRTCCECFVALEGKPEYHEFNFAPSGEWAVYRFAKYRESAALVDEALNPRITVRRTDEGLELDAAIPLSRLSATHPRARLALALSAVIEDREGALSYWALRHPEGKPDFHHRDSFVLDLESP